MERVPFHVGCLFLYECNVVAEIKMGAYIHGVLILGGCLLSQFYGTIISQNMPSYTLGDLSVNRYLGACSHLTLCRPESSIPHTKINN